MISAVLGQCVSQASVCAINLKRYQVNWGKVDLGYGGVSALHLVSKLALAHIRLEHLKLPYQTRPANLSIPPVGLDEAITTSAALLGMAAGLEGGEHGKVTVPGLGLEQRSGLVCRVVAMRQAQVATDPGPAASPTPLSCFQRALLQGVLLAFSGEHATTCTLAYMLGRWHHTDGG